MRSAFRSFAIGFVAAAVLASGPAAAAPSARRIMSMNLCSDLLLLQLAPRARIASVSHLAHEGAAVLFPGLDAGVAINHGTAEDIVNLRPDLILVGDTSTPMTRALASRVGAQVVEVRSANSLAQARAVVLKLGDDIGEPARARSLAQGMDAELADLAAHPPARRLRVVAWSGGAFVPGRGTLVNDIITAAGAVNIAADDAPPVKYCVPSACPTPVVAFDSVHDAPADVSHPVGVVPVSKLRFAPLRAVRRVRSQTNAQSP